MTRSLMALLVCALLAGCGGGSDDDGSGGDGSSKEDFVAQANEICAEGEKKLEEFTPAAPEQGTSPEQLRDTVADELEKAADAYEPYLARLRELEPPDDLADGWTRFMDGIEEAFDKIAQLADATRENDSAGLQELSQEFTQIAQDTRPFAEENGLDDCLPDDSTS